MGNFFMKILVYKTELTMLMTISYAILEYNAASEMQTLEKDGSRCRSRTTAIGGK